MAEHRTDERGPGEQPGSTSQGRHGEGPRAGTYEQDDERDGGVVVMEPPPEDEPPVVTDAGGGIWQNGPGGGDGGSDEEPPSAAYVQDLWEALAWMEENDRMLFRRVEGLALARARQRGIDVPDGRGLWGLFEEQLLGLIIIESALVDEGRPAMLVRNGWVERPTGRWSGDRLYWWDALDTYGRNVRDAVQAVGRIEVRNNANYEWAGTGFLVRKNWVVTNAHVAELFANGLHVNVGFLPSNKPGYTAMAAELDLLREHENPYTDPHPVAEVLYIADQDHGEADIAVLRLEEEPEERLPAPLELDVGVPGPDAPVAVIGYPSFSSQAVEAKVLWRIFQGIFDRKRIAPGRVHGVVEHGWIRHDCTTLKGNSGSPLVDLRSGKVIGVHFSGIYRAENRAVPAVEVKRILARL